MLDVGGSRSLIKTGSFIGLENLEELQFGECFNLYELDSSIGCLKKLVSLYLNNCEKLVNLPSNISLLQNLKELVLDDCFKLGSKGFTQVTRVRNLQQLYMACCNVSQVSSRIGNLSSLQKLDLSRNPFSSLPESFNNLSQLKSLDISYCSQLKLLPPLPSQLRNIEATNCMSLDVMPYDSMQNAYIFPSNPFKESLMSNEGLDIHLSGEEVHELCTYQNSGNVLSFVALIQFHTKICGLILSATRVMDDNIKRLVSPTIYNKMKGTSYDKFKILGWSYNIASMVMELKTVMQLMQQQPNTKSTT